MGAFLAPIGAYTVIGVDLLPISLSAHARFWCLTQHVVVDLAYALRLFARNMALPQRRTIPTGQWSAPNTSLRMNAFFKRGRSPELIRK